MQKNCLYFCNAATERPLPLIARRKTSPSEAGTPAKCSAILLHLPDTP
jgi:hypothetical protein